MRVCFYNPQAVNNVLGITLPALIFENKKRLKNLRRFGFLLNMLRNEQYDTAIVVDGTASSLPLAPLGRLFNNYFFMRLISFLEIYLWCIANGINPFRKKIIFSAKGLNPDNDILFGFAYLTGTFFDDRMTEKSFFKRFGGKKILHATHFYAETKKFADNIRKTGTRLMIAEADLKKSGYFNRHFDFVDSVGIVPFVLRKKYVSKKDFSLRNNKCLAIGTLELFPDGYELSKDHFEHFRTNTLHPMRKAIVSDISKLQQTVDSLIVVYQGKSYQAKKTFFQKTVIYKLFKRLVSIFHPIGKEYHGFDIVEKFNEYKMLVSPEENIGLPSINFIEGMACGCAYIGLDSYIYDDLGMEKGIHYIPYNGTIDGLIKTVEYYQQRQNELAAIATAGRQFVLEHFTEEQVINTFLRTINRLT